MTYEVKLSDKVKSDLARLAKSEPKAFVKAGKLLKELETQPKTGTGHPEQLKGDRTGQWSRQITKKHRMIYEIFDREVCVDVLSAYGHYDDK